MFPLRDLRSVLCSRDHDVQRAQRIMGFFDLVQRAERIMGFFDLNYPQINEVGKCSSAFRN